MSIKAKLVVRKSNKYIYASIFEVKSGKTLGSARDRDPEKAGSEIAKISTKHKVSEVVFDRGRHKYHGQVKKLADSARAGGLKF